MCARNTNTNINPIEQKSGRNNVQIVVIAERCKQLIAFDVDTMANIQLNKGFIFWKLLKGAEANDGRGKRVLLIEGSRAVSLMASP